MLLFVFQALEFDREGLTKLKKAVKAIYNSGNSKLNDMFTHTFLSLSCSLALCVYLYVLLAFTIACMPRHLNYSI